MKNNKKEKSFEINKEVYYSYIRGSSIRAAAAAMILIVLFSAVLVFLTNSTDALFKINFLYKNTPVKNELFAEKSYSGDKFDLTVNSLTVDNSGNHITADVTIKNNSSYTTGYKKSDLALIKYVRSGNDMRMTYFPDMITGDIEASPGEECNIIIDYYLTVIEETGGEISYSLEMRHYSDEIVSVLAYYEITD